MLSSSFHSPKFFKGWGFDENEICERFLRGGRCIGMNKKIIMLITFAIILASAVFVIAGELRVPVEKGWNLIYGLNGVKTPTDILPGSEIQSQNIKAIYVYLPQINSYGRLYPNPETEKILQYLTVNDLENSVYWVYSDKSGIGKFNADEPMEFTQRILSPGWNFYPIYEDMVGKKVSEFKGTCQVEKVYAFEPTKQQWIDLMNEEMQQEALGLGIVVKVKNECKFGEVTGQITPPPAIP